VPAVLCHRAGLCHAGLCRAGLCRAGLSEWVVVVNMVKSLHQPPFAQMVVGAMIMLCQVVLC